MADSLLDKVKALETIVSRLRQKLDRAKGDGVTNTPTSLSFRWPGTEAATPSIPSFDIGTPQYQFQVLQGVAQNKRGWDFVMASPAIT
jgi:hypothetical protein